MINHSVSGLMMKVLPAVQARAQTSAVEPGWQNPPNPNKTTVEQR
jgi:hypothetical protein